MNLGSLASSYFPLSSAASFFSPLPLLNLRGFPLGETPNLLPMERRGELYTLISCPSISWVKTSYHQLHDQLVSLADGDEEVLVYV